MKILLLVMINFCFSSSNGQIRIGVQGGYNHARIYTNKFASDLFSYSTSSFRGFQGGVVGEITLSRSLIFRPSLLLNGKGSRIIKTGLSDTSSSIIELHYLEIPVSMLSKWNLSNNSIAFVGAGLYLARALRGVEKGHGHYSSGEYYIEKHIRFDNANETNSGTPTVVNPFDYGLNALAGIEHKQFQLVLSYERGLRRVFPKSLVFEEKFTNRVFSLSVVYFFKAP